MEQIQQIAEDQREEISDSEGELYLDYDEIHKKKVIELRKELVERHGISSPSLKGKLKNQLVELVKDKRTISK